MTRWSLLRRRRRAPQPATATVRLDRARPELEATLVDSFPPEGRVPGGGNGHPPAGPRPVAYRPAAWPEVMERFGLQLLTLAEQLRISLDELEADEADPDRLQKLYRVDHAVTRMRRASRDLRIIAGRSGDEDLSGVDTSMLDVIRMALSAIERYTQVTVGKVTDFGVLGYAADDVASLLAALLDNATRYSPGTARVSAHLTEGGSVLLRIEDRGIGMNPDGVRALNAMLAGDVPEPDEGTGRRTGFPVVHRIARRHAIGVRLAARPAPGTGTLALVSVPAELMCEMPDQEEERPLPPAAREGSVSVLRSSRRPSPPSPPPPGTAASPGERADRAAAPEDDGMPEGLPRRESASLRGSRPRPGAEGRDAGRAAAPSAEQLAEARRAFADDLAAFSAGDSEAGGRDTAAPPDQDPGKGTPS